MKTIFDAQQNMQQAYFWGVPGIFCSGLAWLIAGLVALFIAPFTGILTLVFGGMAIFPLSVLLCKLSGVSGKHHKENPLAALAIQGTIWMLLCIPIALLLATFKPELFFPAMLLVIAGRYLTFQTLYGMKVFYIFSIVLAISAVPLAIFNLPVYLGGIIGGGIEWLFAFIIYCKRHSY